jgi:response regulator RpfG family c-di-GMP phosphodiesterase
MKKIKRIIMVDDDPYSLMICKGHIRRNATDIQFLEFIIPERGIEFIESSYKEAEESPTVLLLDINMPITDGWDFLERYDKIESRIKDQIIIYLLSSSIDPRDKEKAAANKYVKGFLMKPFRKTMVEEILGPSPTVIRPVGFSDATYILQ